MLQARVTRVAHGAGCGLPPSVRGCLDRRVLAGSDWLVPRVMRVAHGARCGAASVRTGAGPVVAPRALALPAACGVHSPYGDLSLRCRPEPPPRRRARRNSAGRARRRASVGTAAECWARRTDRPASDGQPCSGPRSTCRLVSLAAGVCGRTPPAVRNRRRCAGPEAQPGGGFPPARASAALVIPRRARVDLELPGFRRFPVRPRKYGARRSQCFTTWKNRSHRGPFGPHDASAIHARPLIRPTGTGPK